MVTERPSLDRPHPVWARLYAQLAAHADSVGADNFRHELVEGLSGAVLELGCGPGRNFAHYASGCVVTAIEPEPHLRRLAESAAAVSPGTVDVAPGRGEALEFDDATFDSAVLSYVLCTVDPQPVLAELRRVLKPGAELRFWEHVRSDRPALAAVQRVVDAVFWPRFGAGCHTGRGSLDAIEVAGFRVVTSRRFWFAPGGVFPAGPQVIGRAVNSP